MRGGPYTYLCALANEDVGAQVAGAVADEGREQPDSDDDSHLASFEEAGGAVAAAIALTRSAPVRIGIHTGDAAHARRLAEACDLGSALISEATAALVDDDLPAGARLLPLGDRPLAGADPERLFELEHDPRAARQARERLLFNREQELRVLAAQLARARGGEGALFVTVKTVELHLSNAYRKLALGSRRELAAALAVGRLTRPQRSTVGSWTAPASRVTGGRPSCCSSGEASPRLRGAPR